MKFLPKTLEPCIVQKHAEPKINATITAVSNNAALSSAINSDILWMLCRFKFNDAYSVPGWAGWVSVLSEQKSQQRQSVIGYMTPLSESISEYSTLREVLTISQQATEKLNQKFTLVTFDMAAAIKAYNVIWQSNNFQNVVVNIGAFHTICSYLGCLGKIMAGSGYEDILVASEICASGSINKVMSGKHYNRAISIHKTMMESLERLLFTVYADNHPENLPDKVGWERFKCLAENPNNSNLKLVNNNESCKTFLSQYEKFKL